MIKSWMIVGLMTAIAANCGFAFVVDRSAAAGWDASSGLNSEKASMDRVLNGKMQVTGMDKVLQAFEAKKSVKHVDEPNLDDNSREKRSESLIIGGESLNEAPGIILDGDNGKDSSLPRNVVLLLIDEANQDKEAIWKSFRTKQDFPVQGLLQSCRNSDKYNHQDDPKKDCECEHFLRSNVGALLSWARHAKVMTTGAVSATNFSIPAGIGYEGANEGDENNLKREVRRSKPEFHDAWHLIDLDRQPGSPVAKPEGTNANYDGMWDVFDMFSRIRVAFFRTLLDSLGGQEDDFQPRRPSPLQSNLADLVGDTIKELKSASNEKGYMLVAAAPGNDLSSTVDLLTREISLKDTLLVVAGICAADEKPVPFYANGPGAKSLLDARSVWDLPGAIKSAVTGGCKGAGCRARRHDQTGPTLARAAALIPTADDGDDSNHRRVERVLAAQLDEEKLTKLEKEVSELDSGLKALEEKLEITPGSKPNAITASLTRRRRNIRSHDQTGPTLARAVALIPTADDGDDSNHRRVERTAIEVPDQQRLNDMKRDLEYLDTEMRTVEKKLGIESPPKDAIRRRRNIRSHDQTGPTLARVAALIPTADDGDDSNHRRVERDPPINADLVAAELTNFENKVDSLTARLKTAKSKSETESAGDAEGGASEITADAVTLMLGLATSVVATMASKF